MFRKKRVTMSKGNKRDVRNLRDEFHKTLSKQEFIIEIPVAENEIIEIEEKSYNAKLKKVCIQELNYFDEKSTVERIWKNLNPKQGYHEEEIYIDFKGILFYQTFSERKKLEENKYSKFSEIITSDNKSGTLICQTILRDQDQIKIKCFCHPDIDSKTEIRITLKSLL